MKKNRTWNKIRPSAHMKQPNTFFFKLVNLIRTNFQVWVSPITGETLSAHFLKRKKTRVDFGPSPDKKVTCDGMNFDQMAQKLLYLGLINFEIYGSGFSWVRFYLVIHSLFIYLIIIVSLWCKCIIAMLINLLLPN